MIENIRQTLAEVDFRPFFIVASAGVKYHVPFRDHAGVSPSGTRVIVSSDKGGSALVASLHITAIEEETSASQNA